MVFTRAIRIVIAICLICIFVLSLSACQNTNQAQSTTAPATLQPTDASSDAADLSPTIQNQDTSGEDTTDITGKEETITNLPELTDADFENLFSLDFDNSNERLYYQAAYWSACAANESYDVKANSYSYNSFQTNNFISIEHYKEDINLEYSFHFNLATRNINGNGNSIKKIVAISCSGSEGSSAENDLLSDWSTSSKNVLKAADDVDSLYLLQDAYYVPGETDVAFWIAGHGFGGAVCEQLAFNLLKNGVPPQNILVFDFGCPPVFELSDYNYADVNGLTSRVYKFMDSDDWAAMAGNSSATKVICDAVFSLNRHYVYTLGASVENFDIMAEKSWLLNVSDEFNTTFATLNKTLTNDVDKKVSIIFSDELFPDWIDYVGDASIGVALGYWYEIADAIYTFFNKTLPEQTALHDLENTYIPYVEGHFISCIINWKCSAVSYYTGIHIVSAVVDSPNTLNGQTDHNGEVNAVIYKGNYQVTVSADGYQSAMQTCNIISYPTSQDVIPLKLILTDVPDGTRFTGTYEAALPDTKASTFSKFDFLQNGNVRFYLADNTQSYTGTYVVKDGNIKITPTNFGNEGLNTMIRQTTENDCQVLVIGDEDGLAYIKTANEKPGVTASIPVGTYSCNEPSAITGFSSFHFTGGNNVTVYLSMNSQQYNGTYQIVDGVFMFTSPDYPSGTFNADINMYGDSFMLGEWTSDSNGSTFLPSQTFTLQNDIKDSVTDYNLSGTYNAMDSSIGLNGGFESFTFTGNNGISATMMMGLMTYQGTYKIVSGLQNLLGTEESIIFTWEGDTSDSVDMSFDQSGESIFINGEEYKKAS